MQKDSASIGIDSDMGVIFVAQVLENLNVLQIALSEQIYVWVTANKSLTQYNFINPYRGVWLLTTVFQILLNSFQLH